MTENRYIGGIKMNIKIPEQITKIQSINHFSGTVFVKDGERVLADVSYGYANRSEPVSSTKFKLV